MRFGIVGCGMISEFHAQAIQAISGAQLAGFVDKSSEAAARAAVKFDVPTYASYEEMLRDECIEAVCICTPSGFHAENAISALEHGKHVVVEKPMALTLQEADAIIRAAERNHRLVTVISQLRFEPDIAEAKRLIEDGRLGRIVMVDLSMMYHRSEEYYRSSPWKGTWRMDGGGALMNQGIHGIDLMQYLVGPVKNVCGLCKTLTRPIEVEDCAVSTVEFTCGALGVISATTAVWPGHARRLTICGTEGSLVLHENRLERLEIRGEEAVLREIAPAGSAHAPDAMDCTGHIRQISNLIRAAEGKAALLIDGYEGRKALEMILNIYQSGRIGASGEGDARTEGGRESAEQEDRS